MAGEENGVGAAGCGEAVAAEERGAGGRHGDGEPAGWSLRRPRSLGLITWALWAEHDGLGPLQPITIGRSRFTNRTAPENCTSRAPPPSRSQTLIPQMPLYKHEQEKSSPSSSSSTPLSIFFRLVASASSSCSLVSG